MIIFSPGPSNISERVRGAHHARVGVPHERHVVVGVEVRAPRLVVEVLGKAADDLERAPVGQGEVVAEETAPARDAEAEARRFSGEEGARAVVCIGGDGTVNEVLNGLPLPDAPPPASAFAPAQQFPMLFQSPLARLSIKLTEKIRWNAGYQYYGYHEDLLPSLNYRAHTGYTSLLWTF